MTTASASASMGLAEEAASLPVGVPVFNASDAFLMLVQPRFGPRACLDTLVKPLPHAVVEPEEHGSDRANGPDVNECGSERVGKHYPTAFTRIFAWPIRSWYMA